MDLVTVESEPDAVEVLADAHDTERQRLIIEGVKVDVITTMVIDEADLVDLEDDDRLFVAGHGWAFETGTSSRLTIADGDAVTVRVATPAGLVATKSHAVASLSSRRRATKLASDLLDLFRLVERYDREGELGAELLDAPGTIAQIIADIVDRQVLANPAAATNKMRSAALSPIDVEDVVDIMQAFVDKLRAG